MGNLCRSTLTTRISNYPISLYENELDMYDIMYNLRNGGYGDIFIIKKKFNNELLVMKILKKNKVIKNEIKYHKLNLQNSNLIKYHNLFLVGNIFYIIMDRYDFDLLDYLNVNGNINEKEAKIYVSQILSGLKSLEYFNYFHLDIKLENILKNSNSNHIVITDFGCMDEIYDMYKDIKHPVGTKIYAAPEILNESIIARNSDIWSLGIILFMLIKNYRLTNGYNEKLIKLNCKDQTNLLVDLLVNMLNNNFEERYTISECILHPWFS